MSSNVIEKTMSFFCASLTAYIHTNVREYRKIHSDELPLLDTSSPWGMASP